MLPRNKEMLGNAKQLRREMTAEERKLWYLFLKNYPVKIYKQRIIGSYIVDFYCHAAKLVIELDGSQHFEEKGIAYDARRTDFLKEQGISVLRFTNLEVDREFEVVCEAIHNEIQGRLGRTVAFRR